MAPPRNGYFFRRAKKRHIPVDDPAHQDASIYFAFRFANRHRTICCHTTDRAEAEARIELFGAEALPLDSYDRFLLELARLGRRAEAEVGKRLREKADAAVPPRPTRKQSA